MEYLGFRVTWNGIQPINKKVEAIINMMPPKTPKTGACVHRISEVLHGCVGQTVIFTTPFNCTYVK